jgi:hypothetical protein
VARRLVSRPPYKQLLAEVAATNWTAVGRKYGVSDNAIRKWVRDYERDRAAAEPRRVFVLSRDLERIVGVAGVGAERFQDLPLGGGDVWAILKQAVEGRSTEWTGGRRPALRPGAPDVLRFPPDGTTLAPPCAPVSPSPSPSRPP